MFTNKAVALHPTFLWTDQHVALLKRHYGIVPDDVLAGYFGCSTAALRLKATADGIPRARTVQGLAAVAHITRFMEDFITTPNPLMH